MKRDFVKENIYSNEDLNIDFIHGVDKIMKSCGIANFCGANYWQKERYDLLFFGNCVNNYHVRNQ